MFNNIRDYDTNKNLNEIYNDINFLLLNKFYLLGSDLHHDLALFMDKLKEYAREK